MNSYRVFNKYCVFFRFLKNIPDYGLSLFSLGVSVCTHTRQVEHQQRCSRTGRVQENHKILRKKTQYLMSTVYVTMARERIASLQITKPDSQFKLFAHIVRRTTDQFSLFVMKDSTCKQQMYKCSKRCMEM